MSLEIAWKQNILVTDSNLLKSLLVVFGFGLQAFVCGFSRQNICSVNGKENLGCYKQFFMFSMQDFDVRNKPNVLYLIVTIRLKAIILSR